MRATKRCLGHGPICFITAASVLALGFAAASAAQERGPEAAVGAEANRQEAPPSDQPVAVAAASPDQINECDTLAGHPADPQHLGPGVEDDEIDLLDALEFCTAAVAKFPDTPRLLFQTGRVLWLAEEFDEAMPFLVDAAEREQPAALAYMGDAYANGLGGADQSRDTALSFYAQAAEKGFTPAEAAADELAAILASESSAGASGDVKAANECDLLAAHPLDKQKVTAGVTDDKIALKDAIAACDLANANFPETGRLEFQLGRALFLSGREGDALPWLAEAVEHGSVAAKAYIADAYLAGSGGLEQDLGAAYALYEEAGKEGFAPAAKAATGLAEVTTPAVSEESVIKLTCPVQITWASGTGEIQSYDNGEFALDIDFNKNVAIAMGGQVPTYNGNLLLSIDKEYPLTEVSDTRIRFTSDSMGANVGPGAFDGSMYIYLDDGKVTMSQLFDTGMSLFGAINIRAMLYVEGYCGDRPAPKTTPKKASAR